MQDFKERSLRERGMRQSIQITYLLTRVALEQKDTSLAYRRLGVNIFSRREKKRLGAKNVFPCRELNPGLLGESEIS